MTRRTTLYAATIAFGLCGFANLLCTGADTGVDLVEIGLLLFILARLEDD